MDYAKYGGRILQDGTLEMRDLLAQIIAIAEDALVMAKDRYAETSYARRLEAIEAAKEASK